MAGLAHTLTALGSDFMVEAPSAAAIIRPRIAMIPVYEARVRDLFESVLALPDDDRERWLGEACAGDEGLYTAVLNLTVGSRE